MEGVLVKEALQQLRDAQAEIAQAQAKVEAAYSDDEIKTVSVKFCTCGARGPN